MGLLMKDVEQLQLLLNFLDLTKQGTFSYQRELQVLSALG